MKKMSSDLITALILTYNEEDNIERVLKRLQWLENVIIVDSHSTDRTLEIVNNYPNVKIYSRTFDTHATQWNYALSLTNSKWILSLDADYILTDDFIDEIQNKLSEDKTAFFTK
jgi:glycosyltransferase involved in cell wall biosynthesis